RRPGPPSGGALRKTRAGEGGITLRRPGVRRPSMRAARHFFSGLVSDVVVVDSCFCASVTLVVWPPISIDRSPFNSTCTVALSTRPLTLLKMICPVGLELFSLALLILNGRP